MHFEMKCALSLRLCEPLAAAVIIRTGAPARLEFVEMGQEDSRLVLVLSNKKDCFYVVTDRDCSCPTHNWNPGHRRKHQRKHFVEQIAKSSGCEQGRICPEGKWHGHNGPIDPDEIVAWLR